MILNEFPDINWLKRQIKLNFENQRAWDNSELATEGWPSVILNARTSEIEREEVKGPFSVFLNLKGNSTVKVGKRELHLNDNSYTITNPGEYYDLRIKSGEETTETFNIHFGTSFTEQSVFFLENNTKTLIEKPFDSTKSYVIPFRSFFKDRATASMINGLKKTYAQGKSQELEEEVLFEVFSDFYSHSQQEQTRIESINSIKHSTRIELLRRLYLAIDYVHSNYAGSLKLDKLSRICGLSKFHFLRLFKQAFGLSPHQYIQQLRLHKAWRMLEENKYLVHEVAVAVGFENASSLSRAFYKTYGVRPSNLAMGN